MYTVKDLSNQTGLTEREIRYYIGMNLLQKKHFYSKNDLYQIHQIIILKTIGLSVPHMQSLVKIKNKNIWKKYLSNHLTLLQFDYSNKQYSIPFVYLILNSIEIEGKLDWEKISAVFYGVNGKRKYFAHTLSLKEQQYLHNYPEVYYSSEKTKMLISIIKKCKQQVRVSFTQERQKQIISEIDDFISKQFDGNYEIVKLIWSAQKKTNELFPYYKIDDDVMTYLDTLINSIIQISKTS